MTAITEMTKYDIEYSLREIDEAFEYHTDPLTIRSMRLPSDMFKNSELAINMQHDFIYNFHFNSVTALDNFIATTHDFVDIKLHKEEVFIKELLLITFQKIILLVEQTTTDTKITCRLKNKLDFLVSFYKGHVIINKPEITNKILNVNEKCLEMNQYLNLFRKFFNLDYITKDIKDNSKLNDLVLIIDNLCCFFIANKYGYFDHAFYRERGLLNTNYYFFIVQPGGAPKLTSWEGYQKKYKITKTLLK